MAFNKVSLLGFVITILSSLLRAQGETQLDLVLSARSLPSTDPFNGDPDAYVILWFSPSDTANFFKVGQTKYISDNRNPDWPELFRQYVQYCETCTQRVKADIWDDDFDGNDLIGSVTMKVSDLIKAGTGSEGTLSAKIPGLDSDLIFRINVNRTVSDISTKPDFIYYERNQ